MKGSRAGSRCPQLVCMSFPEQDHCEWILLLSSAIAKTSQRSRLTIKVHKPRTDITTVCGSESPKQSFFWSRACVSEKKRKSTSFWGHWNDDYQNLCLSLPVWTWLACLWWCNLHICMWTFHSRYHSSAEGFPEGIREIKRLFDIPPLQTQWFIWKPTFKIIEKPQ